MDIRKLQRAIVDGLEDVKAQNIVVFNTEALSPLFERVIVASGTSNRQTKALASSVRDAVKASGMQVLRSEGEANGEWIIVDCGAAVVHVMQPSVREYYRLEEIWGGKPVGMKFGKPDRVPERAVSAKKPAARSASAKTPAAPAKRSATRQAPAAKKVASKKAVPKKVAVKQVAAKRAAAKKSAPARKASAAPRKTSRS